MLLPPCQDRAVGLKVLRHVAQQRAVPSEDDVVTSVVLDRFVVGQHHPCLFPPGCNVYAVGGLGISRDGGQRTLVDPEVQRGVFSTPSWCQSRVHEHSQELLTELSLPPPLSFLNEGIPALLHHFEHVLPVVSGIHVAL